MDCDGTGSTRTQYSGQLRRGGRVRITDDEVLLEREEETVRVALDNVAEVTASSIDWFLAILSFAIVVFGVLSFRRSLVGGLAFTVIGIGSGYLTYRKRDQIQLRVTGRAKPLTLYPVDADQFYEAMSAVIPRD